MGVAGLQRFFFSPGFDFFTRFPAWFPIKKLLDLDKHCFCIEPRLSNQHDTVLTLPLIRFARDLDCRIRVTATTALLHPESET